MKKAREWKTDALKEAQEKIKAVPYVEGPEARDNSALLAIAWALVAVCERMDRWLEMQELEEERTEIPHVQMRSRFD